MSVEQGGMLTSPNCQWEGDKETEAIIFQIIVSNMKNKLKPNKSQKTNADESGMWNCGTNDSVSAQQEQSGTSPRDAQAAFLKRS